MMVVVGTLTPFVALMIMCCLAWAVLSGAILDGECIAVTLVVVMLLFAMGALARLGTQEGASTPAPQVETSTTTPLPPNIQKD